MGLIGFSFKMTEPNQEMTKDLFFILMWTTNLFSCLFLVLETKQNKQQKKTENKDNPHHNRSLLVFSRLLLLAYIFYNSEGVTWIVMAQYKVQRTNYIAVLSIYEKVDLWLTFDKNDIIYMWEDHYTVCHQFTDSLYALSLSCLRRSHWDPGTDLSMPDPKVHFIWLVWT